MIIRIDRNVSFHDKCVCLEQSAVQIFVSLRSFSRIFSCAFELSAENINATIFKNIDAKDDYMRVKTAYFDEVASISISVTDSLNFQKKISFKIGRSSLLKLKDNFKDASAIVFDDSAIMFFSEKRTLMHIPDVQYCTLAF